MTIDDLHALIDFHYWARDRMLDAVAQLTPEQFTREITGSFKSVRETLVHLYWADWAWYQIWHGTFPAGPLSNDRFTDLESIRSAWKEHEVQVRAFVAAQAGTDAHRPVHYTRPDGSAAVFALAHMVQHVVNHSSYHRGQVTMMLRQLGAEPAESMDLIRYYRERATVV